MPFAFKTGFGRTDPECTPRFTRSFEHIDWIDGESIVQAESTPMEEGFNSRFHKIIDDLEALGDDARRALSCAAAMRESLYGLIRELEAELERIGGPVEAWRTLTLDEGWATLIGIRYCKDRSNLVHVDGQAARGAGATALLFRLPPGYRPSRPLSFPVYVGDERVCNLGVGSDGQTRINYNESNGLPRNVWLTISFRAA